MPRIARIVLPNLPHHITQRGNNRQDVFFVDDDRHAYLKILAQQCHRHGVALLAYCLMTNHVHLIATPRTAHALAKAIGRTHWLYAQYVNRLHGRTGHLWQNRFYSNAMEDDHCLLATRYIEQNPIRAGLCRVATRFPWSTAAAHCGDKNTSVALDAARWAELSAGLDWREQLSSGLSDQDLARIRRSTHSGRPLATDSFLSKLERTLGKRLRPLPVGRPKMAKKKRHRNKAPKRLDGNVKR